MNYARYEHWGREAVHSGGLFGAGGGAYRSDSSVRQLFSRERLHVDFIALFLAVKQHAEKIKRGKRKRKIKDVMRKSFWQPPLELGLAAWLMLRLGETFLKPPSLVTPLQG